MEGSRRANAKALRSSILKITVLYWADILAGYAFALMQNYLTDVWGVNFTHAAGIVNIWEGICLVLPVFLLFIVDVHLGNFRMLVCGSIAYAVGIGLVTLSTPAILSVIVNTCKKSEPQCIGRVHKVVFFIGMALIAIGKAGYRTSLGLFIQEQTNNIDNNKIEVGKEDMLGEHVVQEGKDSIDAHAQNDQPADVEGNGDGVDNDTIEEQKDIEDVIDDSVVEGLKDTDGNDRARCGLRRKLRRLWDAIYNRIPAILTMIVALFFTLIWSLAFGIPAICHVAAVVLFLSGWRWPGYRQEPPPRKSPLTTVFRVLVAAAFKLTKPCPKDDNGFYIKDDGKCHKYSHTRFLGFLKKASIKLPNIPLEEQAKQIWRLCSLAEVEETKVAIRMVPMWIIFIYWGIVLSIGNTYFMEQASNMMTGQIGTFEIPSLTLILLLNIAKMGFKACARRFILKRPQNIFRPILGILIAILISGLCCFVSWLVELKRVRVIITHKLLDKPDDEIPLSMLVLAPQFFLLGGMDSLFEHSIKQFYRVQAPQSMSKYTGHFARAAVGVGHMFSVLSVYIVGRISQRGGRPNWFQHSLNRSRLDKYFLVLVVLSGINLVVFSLLAICYNYKRPPKLTRSRAKRWD